MTNKFEPSAITDLAALVVGDALASQYEQYVDQRIRQGESFYTKVLAAKGKEVAESELAAWNQKNRMSDFAAAVQPVVRALFALQQLDKDQVKVLDTNGGKFFPVYHGIVNPNKMFALFNPQLRYGNSLSLPGGDDWALDGRLGLKAVTLQAGLNRDYQVVAELGLVLPLRGAGEKVNEAGHVFVGIELNGYTRTSSYEPRIAKNSFLMYQLGLIGADRVISSSSSAGGDFDSAIGFPGAQQYLASALPKLADYLTAMASARQKQD